MNKTPFRGVKYAPLASSISDLANAASGRVSRWRRQLPLLMAVVFGCFLLVAVMMPFFIHRTINTTNDDGPQLAIRLHPEVHAIRKPRTLTFDWNITIGKASPDGVEKEIYLINSELLLSSCLFCNFILATQMLYLEYIFRCVPLLYNLVIYSSYIF